MSIKTKLILTLSLVLLASFLSMSVLSYRVSMASVRAGAIDEVLPLLADNIYSSIQHDLMRPVHVSSLMAHDAFLKSWAAEGESDVSAIMEYLGDIGNEYGFVSSFFVSARTMNYYNYDGILKQISPNDPHDVWYYDFLDLDVDSDLDVDTDESADGRLTVFINHRIRDDDGALLGVTGVGLGLTDIGALLGRYREAYGRTVYLVDDEGVIQIHPDASFVETVNILECEGMAEAAQQILQATEETVVARYGAGDNRIVLAARKIPEFDWFLVVETSEADVYRTIRQNLAQNLATGLAVTLLVILICSFTVNVFQSRLQALATTDDLTGVPNRRHFLEMAERELSRARRAGTPTGIAMLDVDHFKGINDTHGHPVGDQVLRAVAKACGSALRESDLVGRVGGEEFAFVLPEATLEEARIVAERIRAAVGSVRITHDGLSVTVSIGVCSGFAESGDLASLLRMADAALYQAKKDGRDRIAVCESAQSQGR